MHNVQYIKVFDLELYVRLPLASMGTVILHYSKSGIIANNYAYKCPSNYIIIMIAYVRGTNVYPE